MEYLHTGLQDAGACTVEFGQAMAMNREPPVIRKAFRMSVHPGQQDAYAQRHNPIWVELDAVLRSHGVRSYSIFLDPGTNDLFAYAEIESEERWAAIAGTDVCRRWWRSMRELMPSHPDDSPVAGDLLEVFHLGGRPAM
jgi:L-rhamnose mutarotase